MAERSPDPWRVLWRFATSDAVLVALLLGIGIGVALTAWIPQQSSADVGYARWLSQTQARFGEVTSAMRTLGLFGITSSLGFRMLLAILAGCLLIRTVDGIDRLQRDRKVTEPSGDWVSIRDGEVGELADCLRQRRYRVLDASSFLQVDRWPWSGVLLLMVHVGALILLASLLLSHMFGWQVEGLILQRGERRSLPGKSNWVELAEDGSGTHHSPYVVPFVEESGPGVRVSAANADGEPIQLLLTSDAEPENELTMALTGDTYFAIPEAQLVVRLEPQSTEPYSRAQVQIYSSPTGEVISERVTEKGGQATFDEGGVRLTFDPAPYARVTVTRNPGRLVAALGVVISGSGLLGSLFWSGRRFWLRDGGAAPEAAGSFPSWLQYEEEDV